MRIALCLILEAAAFGQSVARRGAGIPATGGGGSIGTPAGSQNSNTSASATISSAAHTTTAGDLLYVFASTQSTPGGLGSCALPNDTGNDTFIPIIPSGGSYLLGARITNGGSGCSGDPSCVISGGGGTLATCLATHSGGSVDAIVIGVAGAGDYTSAPTVTLSGNGCTGATAEITAYGVADGGSPSTSMAWYAKNVAGTASNVVSINFGLSAAYNAVSVAEVSGLSTSTPLDVSPGNSSDSASSITSPSYNTANAAEIALCGSRVEALGQTWTAGTGFTVLTAATAIDTFQTIEYQTYSTTQTGVTASISSGSSAVRGLICGVFKQ